MPTNETLKCKSLFTPDCTNPASFKWKACSCCMAFHIRLLRFESRIRHAPESC